MLTKSKRSNEKSPLFPKFGAISLMEMMSYRKLSDQIFSHKALLVVRILAAM